VKTWFIVLGIIVVLALAPTCFSECLWLEVLMKVKEISHQQLVEGSSAMVILF
jgi:hypothetical protein